MWRCECQNDRIENVYLETVELAVPAVAVWFEVLAVFALEWVVAEEDGRPVKKKTLKNG